MKKVAFVGIGLLVFTGFLFFSLQKESVVPLTVIQTIPTPDASHNPFSPVVISFNRAPKENEVRVSLTPVTDVVISSSASNTLTIVPKTMFVPSSVYQVTINTVPPFSFRFETEQAENNTPGWNELNEKVRQKYIQEHGQQDAALTEIRTKAPIKQGGFQIDYSYKNNTYTVSLSAPYESNKSLFLAWIKQKGVTDLSSVRIQYLNK